MFDIGGYLEASSVEEVLASLKQNPESKIIAGGTDILVKLRERKPEFVGKTFVGIKRIPSLREIKIEADGTLSIGAAVTFSEVEENHFVQMHAHPLAQAVGTVGGPQTRNAGTIGGNICNGATSADSAPILFAYGAYVELQSEEGIRTIPISEFYEGPGRVKIGKQEILTRVMIRKEDYEGYQGHYTKFAQRKALDIANLSCGVLVKMKGQEIEDLRIAFGVAGPTPLRAVNAEAYGKGKRLTEDELTKIGEKCLQDTNARDSWRASKDFREHLIQVLSIRGIKQAVGGDVK